MNLSKIKRSIKSNLPHSIVGFLRQLKYADRKIPDYEIYRSFLKDKRGVEVGGPSTLFKTVLPIYQIIESLDGVNFAGNTVWEGTIQTGKTFNYLKNRKGLQFISDATNLDQIQNSAYDFLISSNCLEHIANPIKAVLEWKRVIKSNGYLVLVLPNKESNFDHKRRVTKFEHLLSDYDNKTTEDDLTHLDEILALHDLSMDPPAGSLDDFKLRCLNNFTNRTLHHHIFDIPLIKELFDYCSFDILNTSMSKRDFFVLGRNIKPSQCR